MEPILTVNLRLEDDKVPETWLVTPELQAVLSTASAANHAAPKPEVFDLSFTTILYAFLRATDSCSRFFQQYAKEQGLNRVALLARKNFSEATLAGLREDPAAGIQQALVCTVSAKKLLSNARDLRRAALNLPNLPNQTGAEPIDVRHLMAAYIYEPSGHASDLESIG